VGDIVFTPTLCKENYAIVIEIKEFRKIGNQHKEVGGFLNDFMIKIIDLGVNNPPILYGPHKYEVDAGTQICFTVKSDDKQFIPPPPDKPNPPDTVNLTWNRAITGATFNIIDPKARLQSGKFCWTPKLNQVSDIPYVFLVTARDNSCPMNAITVRSYSIKINKPVNFISNLNPQNISISPNPSINGQLNIFGNAMEQIKICNLSGQVLYTIDMLPTNEFTQNFELLNSGIYMVSVKANGLYYKTKWVKL